MGTVQESPLKLNLENFPRAEEHKSHVAFMKKLEVLDSDSSVFVQTAAKCVLS